MPRAGGMAAYVRDGYGAGGMAAYVRDGYGAGGMAAYVRDGYGAIANQNFNAVVAKCCFLGFVM